MTAETWKPIVGFEGFYEVSDHGRVRSLDRVIRHSQGGDRLKKGALLRVSPMPVSGYPRVSLHKEGKEKTALVHNLVLEAFVGPRPQGNDACHLDGTRTNNCVCNLRWDTRTGNMADRQSHGRTKRGEDHYKAKLTQAQVLAARSEDRPVCDVARELGVTPANISSIRSGRSWAWLEGGA